MTLRPRLVTLLLALLAACRSAAPSAPLPPPPAVVDAGGPPLEARPPPDAGVAVVRFVAVGDTGHGNPEQYRVGAAMARLCEARGCDFVALLGDNFYPTGVGSTDDPQWETAFVKPYAGLKGPFWVVLGNHDYGGNGSGNELDKGKWQVAYGQVNPRWKLPATHYRFSVGPVDFFAADTNRSMYKLDDRVREDFARWMAESRAPWKVVLGHHPLLSNGRHGNAGSYDGVALVPIANGAGVKAFLEDQVCGRADLYLCGHEHILEWLEATCGREGSARRTELIISGGGSQPTALAAKAANPDRFLKSGLGFLYVVIEGDTLTGTFVDDEGKELFTRSFSRAGAAVPAAVPGK